MIYFQCAIWGYGTITIMALIFFSIYSSVKYAYRLYRKLKYPWEE